jgi:integrase/recombinase XerD
LKNDRLPYQGDDKREGTKKGLSIYTINIRLRNLKTIFRFLFNEEIINKNPTSNIPLVKDDAHEEVQGLSDEIGVHSIRLSFTVLSGIHILLRV